VTESKAVLPLREQFTETGPLSFLLLLVVADFVFIFLHFMLRMTPVLDNGLFSLARDGGYPELYQYIKELWIVVLLLSIYLRTRVGGYLAWSLLFGYLLFDDALQIHERLGGYLAAELQFSPFLILRAEDIGELAVSALAGGVLLTLIAWFYGRGPTPLKRSTRHLLLLVLILVFFGVVVDMMPSAFTAMRGVVEDGGEMIAMSCIAWYVFLLNIRRGNPGFSLRRLAGDVLAQRSMRRREPRSDALR
jgi:hypothetical protein